LILVAEQSLEEKK